VALDRCSKGAAAATEVRRGGAAAEERRVVRVGEVGVVGAGLGGAPRPESK